MLVKKIWSKFTAPSIEAELQDHLDCLIAEGLSPAQAQARLGQSEKILAQCLKEKNKDYQKFYLTLIFIALGLILLIIKLSSGFAPLLQSYFSFWLYLWCAGAVLIISLKIIKNIFEFWGHNSKLAWLTTLGFSELLTVGLVIFYDLDGLEIIMQNSILLIIFLVIGLFLKNNFLLLSRLALLITSLSALSQKQLNLFGQLKCLFVTPDYDPLPQTFTNCQQISLLDISFLPFWLIILASATLFIYFIYRSPKPFIIASTILLIIIPTFFYDFNNYHRLDILFYQPKIIKIYRQTLNRDPAQEDLDFYASHETYLHLDRIEESLKQSPEYNLKNNE